MPKGKVSRPYNRKEKEAIAMKGEINAFKKEKTVANAFKSLLLPYSGKSLMLAGSVLEKREKKEKARMLGQLVNHRKKSK